MWSRLRRGSIIEAPINYNLNNIAKYHNYTFLNILMIGYNLCQRPCLFHCEIFAYL